jgi:hypothetical protein
MTDKEKLDKLVAEIKRRVAFFNEQSIGKTTTDDNSCAIALLGVLSFYDSMQEERTTSVWHDKSEKPIDGEYVALLHKNGTLCCYDYDSTLRYHWPSVVKWAYVDELIKL